MKLLAIETAFEACSVALSLDGDCRERFEVTPRGHAERVLPWVEALLAEAGVPLGSLDAIAFSRGPGSFTSLRIGIGVVQGLAFGAGLPVVPVSSLATTARAAGAPRALVAMDARMQEVFCGAFQVGEGEIREVLAESVCPPEQVRLPGGDGWALVGNGFERFPVLAALAAQAGEVHAGTWPRASLVAELASQWLNGHSPLPAEAAQPVYLRDKVADKPGSN